LHFKIIPGIETNVKTVICSHSTQPVMPGPAATEGRAKKKNMQRGKWFSSTNRVRIKN
jgi:hypothetical protein